MYLVASEDSEIVFIPQNLWYKEHLRFSCLKQLYTFAIVQFAAFQEATKHAHV